MGRGWWRFWWMLGVIHGESLISPSWSSAGSAYNHGMSMATELGLGYATRRSYGPLILRTRGTRGFGSRSKRRRWL